MLIVARGNPDFKPLVGVLNNIYYDLYATCGTSTTKYITGKVCNQSVTQPICMMWQ